MIRTYGAISLVRSPDDGQGSQNGGGAVDDIGADAFMARTTQRLESENFGMRQPPAPGADPNRTPDPGLESEGLDGLQPDGEEYEEDPDDPDSDLEGDDPETPEGEDEEDSAGDLAVMKQRYADLQAEYTRLTEAQKNIDQERAEESSQFLTLSYELEDQLTEMRQRAAFLRSTMAGNADRYRQVNWAAVPPDQVQNVQQQAQQAFALEQNAQQAYEHFMGEARQQEDLLRRRQSQITHTRLRRTIPGWAEDHRAVLKDLREFAGAQGMSVNEFDQLLSPVVIEWAYQAMEARRVAGTVQKVPRKGKQRPPRHRTGQAQQPRTAEGRFKAASKRFEKEPGPRTFHEKTTARLQRGG